MWRGTSSGASSTPSSRVVGVRTFGDELLAAIAPLGLAAAAGTALVVDLDPHGPQYPGDRSVAELVADGPRRSEMSPERDGVAVLRNGGVVAEPALDLVGTLAEGWPSVVLRVGPDPVPFPVIPVRPLWPGWMAPHGDGAAVWQGTWASGEPPGPGPVLPAPGRTVVAALLDGRVPGRCRWVRAWRQVWELPWR